jgi:hypothetical protein
VVLAGSGTEKGKLLMDMAKMLSRNNGKSDDAFDVIDFKTIELNVSINQLIYEGWNSGK